MVVAGRKPTSCMRSATSAQVAGDVAGLQRQQAFLGFLAQGVFQHLDKVEQLNRLRMADIIHAVGSGTRTGVRAPARPSAGWVGAMRSCTRTTPLDNIVDIGKEARCILP